MQIFTIEEVMKDPAKAQAIGIEIQQNQDYEWRHSSDPTPRKSHYFYPSIPDVLRG
jgi:hypothetical protein